MKPTPKNTSWQPVNKWYNQLVDERGHYFHEHIILPGVKRLLNLKPNSSLLDLACGQGVLGRSIGSTIEYTGIDIAPAFIEEAKAYDRSENHTYLVGDVTKDLPLKKTNFTHCTLILGIQNIEQTESVISNAHRHLDSNGLFLIVMNHPCFRIPRQSSWGIDTANKMQYRRINRYLSPISIPITAHPGKSVSPITWSFHQPLSAYTDILKRNKFYIETIEEWASDKESEGHAARMENRARSEFPLFMTIVSQKKHI